MRKSLIILVVIILSFSVVACNKEEIPREELEAQNSAYAAMIIDLQDSVEELKKINRELGGNEVPTKAVYKFSDGTPDMYTSLKGSLLLNSIFEYAGATQVPNTASVNVTANVNIVPSSYWLLKQDGTKTVFNHPSGISGYVQVAKVSEPIDVSTIQLNQIDVFANDVGGTVTSSNNLFLEDLLSGLYSNIQIGKVVSTEENDSGVTEVKESNTHMIKVGVIGVSDTVVTFMFTYPDDTSDELVVNLLKTVKVNNRQLRIE